MRNCWQLHCRAHVLLIIFLSALSFVSGCVRETDDVELHLATASLGGAFYPVGQSISNLVSRHADGLSMLPVVSAGAIQNPRLVHSGEVDFGITNANMAWFAINADGPYQEALDLSAVGTIHPSILHMVTLQGSNIKTFEDLRGKRVAVGPAGGGTYGFLVRLLDVHDMTLDDITASYLSYTDGFAQLGDRNVDAALALAGFPTAAVMQANATHDLSFIELSPDRLATMLDRYPYYTSRSLPKATYRLDRDTTVIGVNNMLIVNTALDNERVFQVTRAIYGHMDEFRSNNAIAAQIDVAESRRLPIPLHPGALQYFDSIRREQPE